MRWIASRRMSEGRRPFHRVLVRPGVALALRGGRFKLLAHAYFWMIRPFVVFFHSVGL